MKADHAVARLSAISLLAGLPPLAWLDLTASEWVRAVRAGLKGRLS